MASTVRQRPNEDNNYTAGNTYSTPTAGGTGYGTVAANINANRNTAGASTAGSTLSGSARPAATNPNVDTVLGGMAGTGFSGRTPTPTVALDDHPYDPSAQTLVQDADGNYGWRLDLLNPQSESDYTKTIYDPTSGSRGRGSGKPKAPQELIDRMNAAYALSQGTGPTAYTDPYLQQIDAMRGARYGDYESRYIPQIDTLTDRLLNRDPFRYNWSDDPLYRQYAARYAQQARQGMQDTMGQAAALTGGYGSSYATAAGQQAYANQMAGLNDAAMQLYQLAADRYDQEGNEMRSNLAALEAREAANRGNYDTDRSTWYGRQDMDLNNLMAQQQMAYQQYQDQVARDQYERQLAWEMYQYWNNLYENKYSH